MLEYQVIEEPKNTKSLTENYNAYYSKAPLGKRLLAILIDFLIMAGWIGIFYMIVANLFISSMPYTVSNYSSIELYFNQDNIVDNIKTNYYIVNAMFVLLPPLVYFLIKDGLGQGQSLGKRIVGLQVVCLKNNTPCSKSISCLRNLVLLLLNIITIFPFVGCLIELITIIVNKGGKRLGDMVAKTQVVNKTFNK